MHTSFEKAAPIASTQNCRTLAQLRFSGLWDGYYIIGSIGIGMPGNMLFHMSRIIPII
ncbi:hypothetical protein [Nocardia sp. NPDC047038]|uniref:hypothetical protein n=1 Tax=Nocardia sp. NPDC047038 TaxID=3154338 RepID=UPI0033F47C4B